MISHKSNIKILSQEFQKLKIRSKSREKKYLINSNTRLFLKHQKNIYLGIIPFRSINLPVYNPNKELFLHQTEVITYIEGMIGFNIPISKIENKNLVDLVIEWITPKLGINLEKKLLHKILDVENSRVIIFTLNLSTVKITYGDNLLNTSNKGKKKKSLDSINSQFQNLSLEKSINDAFLKSNKMVIKKITDFYSQIEVKKTVRELYQNISSIRQNKTSLEKCIPLYLNENHMIHLKYYGLYSKLT